jgi:glycosyltransferase involved in cell wall biosynthesis
MRVLFIHTTYTQSGGEDVVFSQEFDFLRKFHQVDALVFSNRSGAKGLVQFALSIWNMRVSADLSAKIIDFKPDVIHIHNWHFASGPIIFRVAKKFNVPVVHTLHNFRLLCPSATLFHDGHVFENSLKENFPWTAVRKGVFRNSILLTFWLAFIVWFHKKIGTWKMVDRYVCLTPFARRIFSQSKLKLNDENLIIKPNFVSDIIEATMVRSEARAYLFIGRLTIDKGVSYMLEAFAHSERELIIAGDGDLRDSVINYCKSYENIQYLGKLDKKSIHDLMLKCKALIFPSIWYEGMPMTIIEAFSSALPVIASKLGAMESMIEDGKNGFLFEAGSKDDLLRTLIKFESLKNEEKEKMSCEAVKSFTENYSEAQQLNYFKALYSIAEI